MNKPLVITGVVVGLILVVLGILVAQVGGTAVRSASRALEVGSISSNQSTLLPGTPTRFSVSLTRVPSESSLLVLRFPEANFILNEVSATQLTAGELDVRLPCSGDLVDAGLNSGARLVLIESGRGAMLAQSGPLTILPPGRDCLYR